MNRGSLHTKQETRSRGGARATASEAPRVVAQCLLDKGKRSGATSVMRPRARALRSRAQRIGSKPSTLPRARTTGYRGGQAVIARPA
jgi:hypothetical protein